MTQSSLYCINVTETSNRKYWGPVKIQDKINRLKMQDKLYQIVPFLFPISWGSFRGLQEEKWGSVRGRFGDHFRVGDHFGGCTVLLEVPSKRDSSKPLRQVYARKLLQPKFLKFVVCNPCFFCPSSTILDPLWLSFLRCFSILENYYQVSFV